MTPRLPSWRLVIVMILAASPAIWILYDVLAYSVDMPLMDQWAPDIAGLFIRAHDGQLGLGDFLAQHNEHRIIIPRLIFFVLGAISNWNTVGEMVVTWLIACIISIEVLWLSLRTSGKPRIDGGIVLQWFLCNLLIFTPSQWENWLCGLGLANVMPVALTLAAIIVMILPALDGHRWLRTGIAILLATAAMYSCGNGIVAWPLVGAMMLWAIVNKKDEQTEASPRSSFSLHPSAFAPLAALLSTFVLFAGLYFIGFERADPAERAKAYFAGPIRIIQYSLAFLGNAFAFGNALRPVVACQVFGAIFVLFFIGVLAFFGWAWLARRDAELSQRMFLWIVVAGFAVLSALEGAMFRAGLGVWQAGSSRYLAFSIWLPIALIYLIPMASGALARSAGALGKPIWREVPPALAALLALVYAFTIPNAVQSNVATWRLRLDGKGALLLVNIIQDDAKLKKLVAFDLKQMIPAARRLSEIGYLRPPLIATNNAELIEDRQAPAGVSGRIDRFSQKPQEVEVLGHAFKPGTQTPADTVFLTCDNAQGQPIIMIQADMGVRTETQQPGEEGILAQWSASFSPALIPANLTRVTIRAWALDVQTGKAIPLVGELKF